MLWSRARSFPFMSLAACALLLLVLTFGFAEERKRDDSDRRDQAAPAARSQAPADSHGQAGYRPAPGTPAPAPQPQLTPPGRPQPQAPTWRQQPSAPSTPAFPGNGRGGWQARPEPSNSSPRYRSQPRDAQPAPERSAPAPRWTPPQPPTESGWGRTRPAPESNGNAERGRGSTGWYPQGRQQDSRPADNGRTSDRWQPRTRPETTTPERRGTPPGERWQPRSPELPQPADSGRTGSRDRTRWNTPTDRATPVQRGPRAPATSGQTRTPERPQAPERPGGGNRDNPAVQRDRGSDQVRTRVPEASFRGPEAETRVRRAPERPQAMQTRLRDEVRQWNPSSNLSMIRGGRPQRDVVGHAVPRDARFIDRDRVSRTHSSYTHVEVRLGRPTNYYSFIPRGPHDYWEGYWDGYRDGSWDGRRHRPHPAVVINFYYGYYWSDPTWFGFYYPGYYASIYHYYGYCPGWVYPTRVYVYPTDYVYWPSDPYRYYGGAARVDERGADRAIGDVRRAWLDNDVDLFSRHLTDDLDVQVYFDGEYSYTTSTDDYYGMTADALASTETTSLEFDDPIFISSHEVFYTGRHEFYDPDGNRQTVYVSYRLRRLGTEWYIIAVGSSLEPIQHHYQDFRYQ